MTSGLGVNKDEVENTVYNLMLDECSIAESIENTVMDNLYAVSYTHLLGGEMGKNIDKTFIQSKMLNKSKGPAVHSLRAQADKAEYLSLIHI